MAYSNAVDTLFSLEDRRRIFTLNRRNDIHFEDTTHDSTHADSIERNNFFGSSTTE